MEMDDSCNAPIPQIRGCYGDVHTRVKIPSHTYAKPQYKEYKHNIHNSSSLNKYKNTCNGSVIMIYMET